MTQTNVITNHVIIKKGYGTMGTDKRKTIDVKPKPKLYFRYELMEKENGEQKYKLLEFSHCCITMLNLVFQGRVNLFENSMYISPNKDTSNVNNILKSNYCVDCGAKAIVECMNIDKR